MKGFQKYRFLYKYLNNRKRPAASANTTGLTKRYESLSTAKKTLTETLKQFDGLVEVSNLLQDSTKSEEIYSLLSILSQNYKKYSQVLQAQLQVERLTVIENINVAVIEEEVKKTDELKKLYVQHSVVKQGYEKQVRM